MVAVLELSLCNGLTARRPSGEAIALPSRKAGLLLAFLAMQPDGRTTREQAIARLWSDRGEAQARASMRQELVALRKAFSDLASCPLTVDGERLGLDLAVTNVDAVEFQRLCRSGQPADLERAIALCHGQFLDGVVLRDPGGEEWIRGERARLQDLYEGALHMLLTHHLRQRADRDAIASARRLLRANPTHEKTHRILMALLAVVDGRAAALRHFEETQDLLRRELGVDPDSATRELAERIRRASDTGALRALLDQQTIEYAHPTEAPSVPGTSEPPAIAVLPFTSAGGDAALDRFGDGLVDGITGDLARVRSFFVIARASTEAYRSRPVDVTQAGRELGVRYVLLGALQKAADRIRIRTQLVETGSGTMIWSDTHDASAEDIFDLQDRLTERIVGAIAPSVRMAEIERARRKRPENVAAYDLVMQALPHIWAMARESNSEALRLTGEAIRLDPHYALAHAYAGWCQFWAFANNWTDDPVRARTEAYRLMDSALRLDANDPSVLSVAALCATALGGDLEAASTYIDKALRLDPNFAWGWNRSGYIRVYLDDLETARAHFERAALLSPFDPLNFNRYVGLALATYCQGQYDEAVGWADQARLERPGLPWAYRILAAAQAELGRMAEAHAAVELLLADSPSLTVGRVMSSMPFRRRDIAARFAAALAAAGLPQQDPVGEAMLA